MHVVASIVSRVNYLLPTAETEPISLLSLPGWRLFSPNRENVLFGPPAAPNRHPVVVFNDRFLFSSSDLFLEAPGDLGPEAVFEAVNAWTPAFMRHVRDISGQWRIPSNALPDAIASGGDEIAAAILPDAGDVRAAGTGLDSTTLVRTYHAQFAVSWEAMTRADRALASDAVVPAARRMLMDAKAAQAANDYERAILFSAIGVETGAASVLESEYAALCLAGNSSRHRLVEIETSSGTRTIDPVYESLAAGTRFRALLHERPLYLLGKSLQLDDPLTYRAVTKLYTTRNKLAHRGELAEGEKTLPVSRSGASDAIDSAIAALTWFGLDVAGLARTSGFEEGRLADCGVVMFRPW